MTIQIILNHTIKLQLSTTFSDLHQTCLNYAVYSTNKGNQQQKKKELVVNYHVASSQQPHKLKGDILVWCRCYFIGYNT